MADDKGDSALVETDAWGICSDPNERAIFCCKRWLIFCVAALVQTALLSYFGGDF